MSYEDYVDMCIQSGMSFKVEEAPVRFTDLSYDYQVAWNLYQTLSNQLIINPMGTPLAINVIAIDVIFKLYDIQKHKRVSLFNKINLIFETVQHINAPPQPTEPPQES